ncbi:Gfo/Idh/MocA family oxidoreductase [Paenibacillus sp. CGMCC 1.16610]|uniref:Gfo/Idh/MocA family oxidoreductase n=2 Tax=Paenibacillus TaxID=44249 RepID=A0ABU6D4V1_9BACL|nr:MULTISPECIES: Gfo/Idh/MocA family oxidoreductase [Paenibacillus]MBA2937951.1 Gfo/Idh/MocA family oxidoreductase [Paenibacillus sp. CGMCC 1.16610]MCY9658239.1 Gfo/Idh/MocA family oxidoreductase [Paenibacillus anseongense]MEB4792762.1 Gfo/Idh/MocA family oxidoreductase [Paenibacillus chondroitinus]MVQ37009.1 gfo/Idh/MocA family oxidoreductase [Paenibacillus anseongense]
MEKVRIGIIGLGNMGTGHAKYLVKNEVKGAELTAICEFRADRLEWAKENLGQDIQLFDNLDAFLNSGAIDSVLIATPHYDHPEVAIKAFKAGLHVLCEKPAGVYTKQVRQMNEAAKESGKIFSMMYNQRTNPLYKKLKDLVESGELGEIRRTNWIITNWYRSQSYYDSGGWRATWAGEGGGVLINQDPHQLDLWQWTIDMMPKRVRAFCYFGKHRNIEVEDDVTAFVEYENGATGLFVTTTGEAPGTNRFEISGDRGKIVIEDGKLTFWRLRVSEREFNETFKGGFGQPECWKIDIPIEGKETSHMGITQNFVDAILHGTPLVAPGEEGIKGLMLSNAMLLSTWTDNWVDLPIDEDLFEQHLQDKIKNSTVNKEAGYKTFDVSASR